MPESNYSIKFTTDADVKGLQKLAEQTKAAEAEAKRYAETLQKLSEPAAGRSENVRSRLAAEQESWNKRKAALQEEIAARRAADQEAQQRRQAAIDQETSARRTEAELRQKMASEIGQHNVGYLGQNAAQGHEKAAGAADKHHGALGKLIPNLKALNSQLGQVPILGEAIHLLKNPFIALGMAIGVVVVKLREAWQEYLNFQAAGKAADAFALSSVSLRTQLLETQNTTALYREEVDRLAKQLPTVTEMQSKFSEQLERTARIQTEMVDAKLALEHARIDADSSLTPAQKTQAKLQATLDAEQRRRSIASETGQGLGDTAFQAARDAGYRAAVAGTMIPGAERAATKARRAYEASLTGPATTKDIIEPKAKEIADLRNILKRMESGEGIPFTEFGSYAAINKALGHHPTLGAVGALKAEISRKEGNLTTWRNQLDIETQKSDRLKREAESANANLEYWRRQEGENRQLSVEKRREADNLWAKSTQERHARDAIGRIRDLTTTTTASKEMEEQQRAFLLQEAQARQRYFESTVGEHPTAQQLAQRRAYNELIVGLQHPGSANATVRGFLNAANANEQIKGQFGWLDSLYQQIGPAAQQFVPIPAAPSIPNAPSWFTPGGGLRPEIQQIKTRAESDVRTMGSAIDGISGVYGRTVKLVEGLAGKLQAMEADIAYIKGLS